MYADIIIKNAKCITVNNEKVFEWLAIKDKKNVYITFNDDRKVKVSPYHIGSSDLEIANYIFCYDFSEEKYKNYKLNYLKQVYTTSEVAKWEDNDYIKDVIKNFDPFLSKGQIIK